MPSAHGLCAFVCIVLSVIRDAEGEITSPPLNAAAEVNGQAVFNCSATSGPYAWTLTKDGNGTNGEIEITAGCVVISVLENHYRTEQPGGTTTCSLIVFDITMEQAGVYHCVHSDVFRVLLTVIDSSSTLTSNNTQDVIETETVVITCSINYNGSVSPAPTLLPHYYWTDVNGQNVSGSVDKSRPTDNKAVSELSVTAGRQDIVSHTCHIYLELDPHNANGYASNIPTVNNNANSPPIAVLYGIGAVSIKNSTVDGVVILTCTTTGNPEPNYYWTSSNDIANSTVQAIQTGVVGYFECNATNVIRNYTYSNASEVNVTKDYFPPIPPTPPTPNHSSHSSTIPSPATTPKQPDAETTYIVALAVGLSVYEIANLIAMGVFLAYYNVETDANTNGNNRKVGLNKRAFNGRFPWLEKMLPCMNKSNDKLSANCGRNCLWIFVFSLLIISCGVFVFPILMIIVMRGGMDLHGSQDNSQLNLRIDDISVSMKTVNQFHPTPSSPPQRPVPPPNRPTRPPPPPQAITHQNTGERGAIEYAILPWAGRPHLAPAQYLDDDRMFHYAILRRV